MSDEADGVNEIAPWENDEGGYTLTLKSDKGYDAAWFVIRDKTANGMKRRIIAAFDMQPGEDGVDPSELTLIELITNAQTEFHALGNLTAGFPGARVVGNSSTEPRSARQSEPVAAEPADPDAALLAEIEGSTTVQELQKIWARENSQGRPLNDKTKEAWKTKGKSLQEGK